jgi:hypothetical protein
VAKETKNQTVSGAKIGSPAQYAKTETKEVLPAQIFGINADGTLDLVVFSESGGVEFIKNVGPDEFVVL